MVTATSPHLPHSWAFIMPTTSVVTPAIRRNNKAAAMELILWDSS